MRVHFEGAHLSGSPEPFQIRLRCGACVIYLHPTGNTA
jgi:hypothetical protein